MTTFNLNGSSGVWFDLKGGGRVQLRAMDADTLKAIRKQVTKTRVEYKTVDGKASRFVVEDVDEDLQHALFWDHIIADWEHFFDATEQPIPCTRDTKLLLLAKSAVFRRVVTEALDTLNQGETAQAEAAEKNS